MNVRLTNGEERRVSHEFTPTTTREAPTHHPLVHSAGPDGKPAPLGQGTRTSLCSGLVLHLKYFFFHVLRDELSHVWLDLLLVNLSFPRLMMESFLKCKCIIG